MEILHTINAINSKTQFINVDLSDLETRYSLVTKTPTTTLPFLETNEGNIAQSTAIESYLCSKYKPELLGNSEFEKAKVEYHVEDEDILPWFENQIEIIEAEKEAEAEVEE